MFLLSMSFYVVILLRGGNCASGGGDITDDLMRALEQFRIPNDANVITPDDLTRALEHARKHSIQDEEKDLAKALALSFQSTPGELTTPVDTKYTYLRSLIKDTFHLVLHEIYVIKPAMDGVTRHKHLLENAKKLRDTGHDLYNANRQMIASCNVLYGIRTLFEKSARGSANIIAQVESLYRESLIVVTERPTTTSQMATRIPMDIDTDVEMTARYVVFVCKKLAFQHHFDNLKVLFQEVLSPAIHHCETALRSNKRFPGDMRSRITKDLEKEAARLFEGHERHDDGRIVEPESIFYSFAVDDISVDAILAIYNFVMPYWSLENSKIAQNDDECRNDLYILADLIRRRLSHIEVDFDATRNFLDSASSMSLKAEALGYFLPFHSAAASSMAVRGFLRIDDMKLRLITQLAKIESIIHTIRDRL